MTIESKVSLGLSLLAFTLSGLVAYYSLLKPFSLDIYVDPLVQIQHKSNFGIYLTLDLYNNTPGSGMISKACLIMNNKNNIRDKFLLEFDSFRVMKDNVVYVTSEQKIPVFFESNKREIKIMSFLYNYDKQFPISMGIYNCELLVWINNEDKVTYKKVFQIDISSDILDDYKKFRDAGSTNLIPIDVVGYTPLKSKKITANEYKMLF